MDIILFLKITYNLFLEAIIDTCLMNKPMKNILPALTQEEFKNILHLIASRDSECRVLGQTFAKYYGFSHKTYVNNIILDREYVVTEKYLYPINGLIEING